MSGQELTIRINDDSEEGQSCEYHAYGTGYAPTTSQRATQASRSSNNSRSSSGQPPSTKTSTPVGACDHAQYTLSAQENQTLQPFEDTLNRLWSSNHRGESVDRGELSGIIASFNGPLKHCYLDEHDYHAVRDLLNDLSKAV
ncbi:uncharacterized protein L199_002553 [Kwoniella botswanensis]|uniref:uncharacterized protein n=1 Tax=Kwoniella botswanensis TaxID=1268659 RepID=UPI00315DF3EA